MPTTYKLYEPHELSPKQASVLSQLVMRLRSDQDRTVPRRLTQAQFRAVEARGAQWANTLMRGIDLNPFDGTIQQRSIALAVERFGGDEARAALVLEPFFDEYGVELDESSPELATMRYWADHFTALRQNFLATEDWDALVAQWRHYVGEGYYPTYLNSLNLQLELERQGLPAAQTTLTRIAIEQCGSYSEYVNRHVDDIVWMYEHIQKFVKKTPS